MAKRPSFTRRWVTAATWPLGVALTSWDYMWRSTPMHRSEEPGPWPEDRPILLEFPPGLSDEEVQGQQDGNGPLFHRRYCTQIRDAKVPAQELMAQVKGNLNKPAPTTFARFEKVGGELGELALGDEFVVRMPGPWDGPVRVIDVTPSSFRFATLAGHLEAGQIEFRAQQEADGKVTFEIESWARSGSWLSNLLYHHLRMSKEIQAHMWISFLEGVVALSGGRMTGGVTMRTRRIETSEPSTVRSASPRGRREALLGPPGVRRKLASLSQRPVNFDPEDLRRADPSRGWRATDLCQALPPEPPGEPLPDGSWEIARRLMRGYEFADPSIVRAYYDPAVPLRERNMLLKLQALRVFHLFAGVRVSDVYERVAELDGRTARIWGWSYRTLEGHVEMGEMDWEVWKWLDSGEVEFRVHAVSRTAPIRNPVVRVGFWALRGRERRAFLDSTERRMRRFTELALEYQEEAHGPIREAARTLTARPGHGADAAHDALAGAVGQAPPDP